MAFPLLNIRFVLLISASFIAIFSSIAIYFCLPILISHVLRTQLSLSASSGSFNDWRTNTVTDRIYLYNITNLSDLLSDTSKRSPNQRLPIPKLEQVGPFTFRQIREKINIKFDSLNETVVYDQKKTWTFLPELSVLKTLDEMNSSWINHINVPLAGTTMNPDYAEFIEPIVSEFDLKLFLNHSVNTLLFEGYFDILMEQAKSNSQLDVDKFGWMHNQNNSITKSLRIFTGPSNATLDKFGSIDEFNYKKSFKIWHNNLSDPNDYANVKCNEFRFSSAGEFFPPPEYSIISHNNHYTQYQGDTGEVKNKKQSTTAMDRHLSLIEGDDEVSSGTNEGGNKFKRLEQKIGKTISLFMPELCRTIRLYYNGSYNYKDLLVDRYIANEMTYEYTSNDDMNAEVNNDNKCFCIYNENTKLISCPPNGMMDLYSCKKGSPITISFPHFLYSNNDKSLIPYLRMFEDNIEPNIEEHQFFIDLESTLNVPVNAQIVLQFNVHFRQDPNMNFTREYSYLFEHQQQADEQNYLRDIYLPQMWIKSTAEIDEKNLNNLRFIQKHLGLVTPLTTITIFGFASILLLASAKLAYDLTYGESRKSVQCDQESCSSFNLNHDSYLNEKQKYYAMQFVGNSSGGGGGDGSNKSPPMVGVKNRNNRSYDSNNSGNHEVILDKPTTSKGNCEMTTTSGHDESQPLNG